jgi:hypothetical protein
VRGIRLKIIIVIVGRLFLIPAGTEFVIGHLHEKYDVFSVEQRHKDLLEELSLNRPHFQSLSDYQHVLSDVQIDLIRELFALVNVVKKHDKDVGLGAVRELYFGLRVSLLLIVREFLSLKDPHEVIRMLY